MVLVILLEMITEALDNSKFAIWILDSDSDSDKVYSTKYIQVPYQVYMSFLEIQITL